jgi:ATP-dependent DNA helicase RecQ
MRRLWREGGGELLYRGAALPWRVLTGLAGDRGAVESLLGRLQKKGFIGWSEPVATEGIQLLDRSVAPERLPVDWTALARRRRSDEHKLKKMQGYAYHEGCRRGYVLRYFGDPDAMESCGACDNCLARDGAPPLDSGGAVPEAGEGDRRPRARPHPRSPVAADPLLQELRVVRSGLSRSAGVPAYFVLTDAAMQEVATRRPTTPEELLQIRGVGERTVLRFGQAVLNCVRAHLGQQPLEELLAPERRVRTNRAQVDPQPPSPEESERYAELRALRGELARSGGLPAYCVFHDRTLVELARRRPQTPDELLKVPGLGQEKVRRYGDALLSLLQRGQRSATDSA